VTSDGPVDRTPPDAIRRRSDPNAGSARSGAQGGSHGVRPTVVPTFAAYEPPFLEPLVALWREAFEFGVGVVDPHPIAEQREHFLSTVLPAHAVTLALVEGRLAGFVAASAERVAQLHVRVGLHGRGIGSALLDGAKARSGGSLRPHTFARNVRACRFYETHGFVAVERGFEPVWKLDDVLYRWQAGARDDRPVPR
jgi:GNAT superfamily N-acetyltransferase